MPIGWASWRKPPRNSLMFSCTKVCVVMRCCQDASSAAFGSSPWIKQVGDLEIRRLVGELLDRVAAILEHAVRPVEVRDRGTTGGRVHERRVVRHQAEIVLFDADRAEVERPDRAVDDRDLVAATGAIVDDGQRVLAARGVRFAALGTVHAPAPMSFVELIVPAIMHAGSTIAACGECEILATRESFAFAVGRERAGAPVTAAVRRRRR